MKPAVTAGIRDSHNTRSLSQKLFVVLLVLVVALLTAIGFGQAISGNVVGTITDSTGAAVTGADITATNIATGVVATTKPNEAGEYRFDNLLVGTYRISVKAAGFRTVSVQVEIQLNTTGTANVTLLPGATSETVEVSGEAPIIDTTTAQLQTTYENKELQDLPTTSLGFNSTAGQNLGVLNLSLLSSGVGSTGGLGAGTGPSVGGQRPRNNNFTVEGVDNNDKGVTGPLIYVPADAVANFTVLQNQFNSEFGHSTGGQFNLVVKSGTNSFHGTAYEFFQNRNLNAIDQSVANSTSPGQPVVNPRYDSNRFGGQIGGPVVRNKLFFFANYEYAPLGEAAVPGAPVLAPTAAGYATALGVPGVSTANIKALQNWAVAPSACTPAQVTAGVCPDVVKDSGGNVITPAGTVGLTGLPNGTGVQVGVLPILAPFFVNYTALTTSMDYNPSDRDQIRGRYIYNKNSTQDITAQLPQFFTPFAQPFHLIALSEYHTFSPTITNEVRVGFNRTGFNLLDPGLTFLPTLDQFPNITINNLGQLDVGPDPNAPQYATQNLYQAVDNITWIKHNHTLQLGVEGRKSISPQKFIQRSRGDYIWASFDSFAHDDTPDGSVAQRSFGNVGYSGDQYGIFWYVNDNWKIKSNLSINLGVRYEYTSTPYGWTQQTLNSVANVPGLITFGSPQAPTHDFMPRVGFAYSPGSKGNTSIRGGFGMGYDVLYDNIGTTERPPQIGSTVNCPNPVCNPGGNGFLAQGGIPPQNLSGITILPPDLARNLTSAYLPNHVQYPYSESWNLGVQRVFAKDYTAEVRYVGTRGVDLDTQNILNFIPGVTRATALPTFLQTPTQAQVNALTNAWAQCDPGSVNTSGPVAVCVGQTTSTGTFGCGDIPGTLAFGYCDNPVGAPGNFYDPQYQNAGFISPITAFMPWGASTYHGLQTQLNRRFNNGLQFQAAYTYSHLIDNSTADFHSTDISPRRPQDFRDLAAERGNSILDHRHRITLSTIYDTQWFKHDSSWLKRNVLGNYEIAPVFTWESGQWGTVQSGTDSNLNADGATDRAIFNPNGVPNTGSDIVALVATAGPNAGNMVAYQAVNPNAQFIVAGSGTLPTSSRNTLTTPPINNWDLTIAKHIVLGERYRIELMAQALNALNHPEFVTGSPNQALQISDVGSQRNYFIPNQPNFFVPRQSFPSNARTMQLAVKFSF
ncbi:MAG TPA: TonB-dependent receptor [Verrucomicrobiae bacterium]|nr:TonB-dependent receptor [Verrucomicrobiae bacterium]